MNPSASQTPIPSLRGSLLLRELRVIVFFLIVGGGLLSVLGWGDESTKRTIVEFLYYMALAQMWNLLAGYAGMVSVGQQAWIGIGGYALMIVADKWGINMYYAVFMAGVVAALISIPTAFIVFRLQAAYFAIGTWVTAEVFRLLIAGNTGFFRGESGWTLSSARNFTREERELITYLVAVVIGLGSIAIVYLLVRSRAGLGLTAIRDSEAGAASLGVNTYRIKLLVFVIAAFWTGITGALIYVNLLRITPSAGFNVQWTAFMIFIVVIGGIGSIEGPIIGTLIFFYVREYLPDYQFMQNTFAESDVWSVIFLGAVAVGIMLIAPGGIWGLVNRFMPLELFPVRRLLSRHLRAPSTEPE
jgi:branched-chain amino acid transport system permease protein